MHHFKKIISILLVICMTASFVPVAFSASVGTVDVGDAAAVYGQEVTVPVTITAGTGVWAMKFFVCYPTELSLVSATSTGVFGAFEHSDYDLAPEDVPRVGDFFEKNSISTSGIYACCIVLESFDEDDFASQIGSEPSAADSSGTVVNLTFRVPSFDGTYDINIYAAEVIDDVANDLILDFTSGTITVSNCLHENGYAWFTTTAPTCTAQGEETYMCVDCHAPSTTVEPRSIPAKGHAQNIEWTEKTPATCVLDGTKVKVCPDCGEEIETDVIPALGHSPSEEWTVIYLSNCQDKGLKARQCTVCGYNCYTEELPLTEHSPVVSTDSPSCTEPGHETVTCSACNAVLSERDLPATGHTASDWLVIKEPTCTEPGLQEKSCTVCGVLIESEEIESLGHTPADRETVIAPTCTEAGSYIIKCSVCNVIVEEGSIEANGHTFSPYFTIDVQPTPTTPGIQSRHCLYCDAVTDVTEISSMLMGDANSDGIVTVKDSLLIKKHLLGLIGDDGLNFKNSDIDGDGEISTKDHMLLKKYLVCIIPSLEEYTGNN